MVQNVNSSIYQRMARISILQPSCDFKFFILAYLNASLEVCISCEISSVILRGCYTPSNLRIIKAVVLLSSCHNSWEKLWKLKSICSSKSVLDSYMGFCFASWGISSRLWIVSYSFPITYVFSPKDSFFFSLTYQEASCATDSRIFWELRCC